MLDEACESERRKDATLVLAWLGAGVGWGHKVPALISISFLTKTAFKL